MSLPEEEKLNKIEDLKTRLYSRGFETKTGHHEMYTPHPNLDIPSDFQHEDLTTNREPKMKTSIFKKFFVFSVFFFCLALLYVGYMVTFGGNTISNENIDINVIGNTFTGAGEELPLVVEIVNKNNTDLLLVDLVIEYPKSSSGFLVANERLRSSLGTITAGTTRNENVKIILFGEQGMARDVRIMLEYRLEGSNSIFVKEKPYEVTINSTPLSVVVDAPAEVSPNRDLTLKVKASLNSEEISDDALLKVDYPLGFQFESANPAPDLGNNIWGLEKLKPGTDFEISITGRMVDVFDGEEKTFHVSTGFAEGQSTDELNIVLSNIAHTVAIKRAFIEARVSLGGVYQNFYTVSSKNSINAQVNWSNNLDSKINDLSITVRFSGNALDKRSIKPDNGFYNSSQDYIVWDKNSNRDFAEVDPGESGAVHFSIQPTPLFSAAGGLLSDPSIKIDVSISGKRALEGNILQELENFDSKNVRISTDLGFNAKSMYYAGPFQNTGPLPPKADSETTYTIVWSLTNTSNTISKTKARAIIPQWMRFTGEVDPRGEDLTYNPQTREVIWNAGIVPRGAGITTAKREVAFQLALIPSITQINGAPIIIGNATLTGHDDFANVDLSGSRPGLSTILTGDPGFKQEDGRVRE